MSDSPPPAARQVIQEASAALGLYFVVQLAVQLTLLARAQAGIGFPLLSLILSGVLALGGLRTAEALRWLANFASGAWCLLPALVLLQPWSLSRAYLHQQTGPTVYACADALMMLLLTLWLNRKLQAPELVAARSALHRPMYGVRLPRLLGLALAVVLFVRVLLALDSPAATLATQAARQNYGPQFRYFASVVQKNRAPGGAHHLVKVVMWNDADLVEQVIPVSD